MSVIRVLDKMTKIYYMKNIKILYEKDFFFLDQNLLYYVCIFSGEWNKIKWETKNEKEWNKIKILLFGNFYNYNNHHNFFIKWGQLYGSINVTKSHNILGSKMNYLLLNLS